MVAYSFKKQFIPMIETGEKRQTVRADRRRHARPGEAVQLYFGMRTKQCRKILTPDPICERLGKINIWVDSVMLACCTILVDGEVLDDQQVEQFAWADGFRKYQDKSAYEMMMQFWFNEHGPGWFDGVVIYWQPFGDLK